MPNDKEQKTLSPQLPVKVFVTLFTLFVLFLHVFSRNDRVDGTAALLLVMAILPWPSDLLDTLELPGGWKFHFRNIAEEQTKQRKRLEQLALAFRLPLTDAELLYLKNLVGTVPMPLHRDYTTPMYEKDLRRLKALGLIEGSVGTFMHNGDDAHKYLAITKEGISILKSRLRSSKTSRSPLQMGDFQAPQAPAARAQRKPKTFHG